MSQFNYNERSHAIDLITEINSYLQTCNFAIKKAGGEATLKNSTEINGKKRKILFPDLLLYGDKSKNTLLQGWEIKLPDIEVTDETFIADALYKADVMNLNSTLLWNFKDVVLYIKKDNNWTIAKAWTDLNKIKTRKDVESYRNLWIGFIKNKFLKELNNFFLEETIEIKPVFEVTDNITVYLINNYKEVLAEHLRTLSKRNIQINAFISKWWKQSETEFMSDEADAYKAYSKLIILSWITRITFSHIIADTHLSARNIKLISPKASPEEMNHLFKNITEESDFFTIFNSQKFDNLLPESLWTTLLDFNTFLIDKTLSHKTLQNMLEQTVSRYKREIVGQFTTPEKLARLLVRMTLLNIDGNFIDPCCGSGTIPKQVQAYMKELNIDNQEIHDHIWAADKLNMPLQITNLALTSNDSMNKINKVFQHDVLSLLPDEEIVFTSPIDGSKINYNLPKFSNILSNLPFVPFELIEEEDKIKIESIKLELSFYNDRKIKLSTKSDYYYYIILHLKKLLKKNGRIGLILSNSWLGTDSGKILYKALNEYFEIDTIMISGNGKWFDNANVMSSILILNHKSNLSKSIKFLKLNYPLKELTYEEIDTIANDYILEAKNPYFTQSIYTKDEVSELQNKNISLNSLFFDVSWLNEIEDYIVPLSNNFQVIRGMRRGWDPLFYPPSNHNIEKEYIEPVIKSSRNIKSFNATPDGNAFCCSKTIKELEDLNHIGALSWINKFENGVNKVGIPLTQSLKTGKLHWYEMRTINSLAEIVTSINPGKRIFWSALATPSFINQRLIGLNRNENCETSITLLVALLNSILGLFFIESIGFGRGLGALDIQKNNIEKSYMLNPDLLSDDQKAKIIVSFKNLGNDISEDTRIDLYSSAREDFDKTVLSCYGIVDLYDSIRVSLVNMMNTRIDVRE